MRRADPADPLLPSLSWAKASIPQVWELPPQGVPGAPEGILSVPRGFPARPRPVRLPPYWGSGAASCGTHRGQGLPSPEALSL